MKNGFQAGVTMDWTNALGSTAASGRAVVVGARVGVVHETTLNGAPGVLLTEGVYTLPCTQADTFIQGAVCYLIPATGVITSTASGNTLAGYAFAAKAGTGATDITIQVKINA
jgi:predicted RecA/RadA family phage recombinase